MSNLRLRIDPGWNYSAYGPSRAKRGARCRWCLHRVAQHDPSTDKSLGFGVCQICVADQGECVPRGGSSEELERGAPGAEVGGSSPSPRSVPSARSAEPSTAVASIDGSAVRTGSTDQRAPDEPPPASDDPEASRHHAASPNRHDPAALVTPRKQRVAQ